MTYNVILFSDVPSTEWFSRSYGIYRLATEIRKHGYTVLTVDFTSALSKDEYYKLIKKVVGSETLMVGFSTTWFPYRNSKVKNDRYSVGFKSTGKNEKIDFERDRHAWYYDSLPHNFSQNDAQEWIAPIKEINSSTKIVIGGAKSYEYIDVDVDNVFIGFSEVMIIDYLNSISKKGPRRIFNKIIDYDMKAQDPRFEFKESRTEYVETDLIVQDELMTIEFSRGCIFNCTFCSYPHKNQKTKDFIKYKETIREELMENYEKWGTIRYLIVDDTFNDSVEKLIHIKSVIETLPFKPKFWAYIRLDLIAAHPEMAQLLKDIGVTEAYYGLETWHDQTAKIINKGGKIQRKIEGMRIAKECWGNDVYVTVGIIIGLPHDTVESIIDSCNWMIQEGHKYVDWLALYSYTLIPPQKNQSYRIQSDIEKDLEAWGYSFPDVENKPFEWVRTGPGDIHTKEQADVLMHDCYKMIEKYNRPRDQYWFQGALVNIDPRFNFENLRNMHPDERGKVFSSINITDLYYKYIRQEYWEKLFKFLDVQ